MNLRKAIALIAVLTCASPAFAKGKPVQQDGADVAQKKGSNDTITWWCLDMQDLLRVKVPVVVAVGNLVPPDPPPISTSCTPSAFPVAVPKGSQFVAGGLAIWFANKTYPPAVRAALASSGFNFVDNSPHTDLMRKIAEIRVEIRTFPDDVPVATFSFDPQKIFRLVQYGDGFGAFQAIEVPIVDPTLGIDISVAELERLPMLAFPGLAGPVAPGSYRGFVFWVMSDLHNDGLGLDPGNFLVPGDNLLAAPRFVVTP
ncbi:MAG: hypothetical protein ACJ79M_21210 [Myxococcales bacterium]